VELVGEDHELAERVGFGIRNAYRPFVLAVPGQSAGRHVALAGELRGRRILATAEGPRVVGLAEGPISAAGLYAQAGRTVREHLAGTLDELRAVVEIAAADGRTGLVDPDDYLAELLLRRSPRLAARIARRVYGPLDDELARTLDLLIENGFDRSATAAALPVHRNTLTNRLARIAALTGVDVDCVGGRELAWLAWLERPSSRLRTKQSFTHR
jgi:hypothetical protein